MSCLHLRLCACDILTRYATVWWQCACCLWRGSIRRTALGVLCTWCACNINGYCVWGARRAPKDANLFVNCGLVHAAQLFDCLRSFEGAHSSCSPPTPPPFLHWCGSFLQHSGWGFGYFRDDCGVSFSLPLPPCIGYTSSSICCNAW